MTIDSISDVILALAASIKGRLAVMVFMDVSRIELSSPSVPADTPSGPSSTRDADGRHRR